MKFVLPPLKILGCWFLKNYNKIGAVSQCFYGVAGLLCMKQVFDAKYGVFARVFWCDIGGFSMVLCENSALSIEKMRFFIENSGFCDEN